MLKEEKAALEKIREAEDAKAAKEQAVQAKTAMSNFLAKISHEIRTPLNAVLGITEIQLQNEKLPADIKEALGDIYDAGYLLLNIISDILDMSKIEAGKLELMPVNYDIASLVNDTVNLNISRFDSKPIEFSLHVDENIPSILFGDELRIKQILNNLLSNAFKYTDSGKISLSVAVENKSQETKDHIMLIFCVSDTGQGMTQEDLDNLFNDYSRFNIKANRTIEGTGLGMSITKHLVQLMNGDISMKSEVSKGSVFTVRVPQKIIGSDVLGRELAENLQRLNSNKTSHPEKLVRITREYMPYGRILIVDDVETNLYVASGLMAPYGLSIETAGSGLEAIEKIKNGAIYDVIFMDHYMPKLDGIETTKIIRDMGYNHSIVALTANALGGQAEMFHASGFNEFIFKPIDIRQLNSTLNRLVRDKYPPETIEAARKLKENVKKHSAGRAPQQSVNIQLAEIFVRDAKKAVMTLEAIHANNYRRSNDIQMFIISVHSMKSALTNIGEPHLSEAAGKLEQAGRERNTDIMTNELPVFITNLKAVIDKVSSKEDDESAEITDEDQAYLRERLLAIEKACSSYDNKAAREALALLRQRVWPSSVREMLNEIATYLLHSDFDEAAGIARDYGK
jgi:CheY-like chemotaxis protein/nitrogen-specific signal transduction histidine kinase/HPt (histidine-containing phosphotransfer) domain-containing protein